MGEAEVENRSGPAARKFRIGAWLPALSILAASFAASAWLELRPADDRYVAAVFPPWWDATRSTDAIAAADGAVLGWGGLQSIVVARSDRRDFAARLHAAGALLLIDPSGLASCAGGHGRTIENIAGRIGA